MRGGRHGWKKQFNASPIVDGDFDWYKITFPFNCSIIKTTNKTTDKTTDKIKIVFNLLSKNPHLTAVDIGNNLGISEEGARYYLSKLKNQGRIKRKGSKKTGEWIVIK
ncbi:MAG: winged helix-turn-helix transcriptional regulator [Nanoarchaeota archaeon]|nr:winged helix-turn-helix transcriptional regulator [Nanoarchaeota archaeon]MCG2720217.1 winged helix-turn-helix transcriptional regulator [Nanoarchaeota archaeon]